MAKKASSRWKAWSVRLFVLLVFTAGYSISLKKTRLKVYAAKLMDQLSLGDSQRESHLMMLQQNISALMDEIESLKAKLIDKLGSDEGNEEWANDDELVENSTHSSTSAEKAAALFQKIANLQGILSDDIGASTRNISRSLETTEALEDSSEYKFKIHTIQESEILPHAMAVIATRDKPYVAETFYHHGTFPMSKIVMGGRAAPYFPEGADKTDPASLIWPAQDKSEAICILRSHMGKYLAHKTPHNLQQVLRCFSWWQQNPTQQPVLRLRRKHTNAFVLKMYEALETVFGIKVRVQLIEDTDESTGPAVIVDVPKSQIHKQLDSYVINSDDARLLANGILNHYLPKAVRAGCPSWSFKPKQKKPSISFVNREGSRRSLKNHVEVIAALKAAGYGVNYIKNFDRKSMIEQAKFMSQADIVMGPHGAQFSSVLFQPECGSLLEFFPRGYYAPNFFGSLAAITGKHHFVMYNGGEVTGASMQTQRVAKFYRVDPQVVVEVTHQMVSRWYTCCQSGFRGA